MKRIVRSCRFSTSYVTENQQITLHTKTANSYHQQEEQKYKSLFHHYIVSLNYAIAKVQKLLQQHTILYLKITKNQQQQQCYKACYHTASLRFVTIKKP